MQVLALNGPQTGIVERPDRFTEAQKQHVEHLESKMQFTINGIEYVGVCRECGRYIKKKYGYYYLVNQNAYGDISVDVYHKYCN